MNICYVRCEKKAKKIDGNKEEKNEKERMKKRRKKKSIKELTIIEESQPKKKDDDTSKKWKKNASVQISKQTKRKKREQQQQKYTTSKSVNDTFFSSSPLSLSLTLWLFFFLASYIHHSYDSNCPWLMVLRQNFSFFFLLSKYAYDTIITYIIILGKEKKR